MKIKIRYLAAIAAGMLMISGTTAAQTVAGAGAHSCGKFLDDVEAGGEVMNLIYFAWIQGFLTGLNTKYLPSQEFATNISDRAGMELWIKNYCEDNPLDQFTMAGAQLWAELRVKQGLRPST